jgi:SsrA-binding protein
MSVKVLITNRKAYHDYNIGDKFEAGIVLQGTEVKSLRASKANLMDGWIDITDGQATLCDISISQYSYGNIMNHEEKRPRRLLLSKLEIIRLQEKIHEKGFTIIPLKIYFKGRYIKVEVALAKGKKLYDKRESEKKKQANRDIERALKSRGD